MTHLESIQSLTKQADAQREIASGHRVSARQHRDSAANAEKLADAADLRATAYEESIDALQALSTMEATA